MAFLDGRGVHNSITFGAQAAVVMHDVGVYMPA